MLSWIDITCKALAALASAAALVVAQDHCTKIAQDIRADTRQILTAISSVINAKITGDITTTLLLDAWNW